MSVLSKPIRKRLVGLDSKTRSLEWNEDRPRPLRASRAAALTLIEVVISLAIAGISITGIVTGYIFASREMEETAGSTAAECMARQRVEQARSAKWDTLANPPVDELVSNNFPVLISPLDIPVRGTTALYATNTTTISTASDTPPLRIIRVESVWSLPPRGPFTNTITAYRAPDQ